MDQLDAAGMEVVSRYAPARIAGLGLLRVVFGLLLGVMAGAAIWATVAGDMKPTKRGDMPEWWSYVVASGLLFAMFYFVTTGAGRALSSFVRGCTFRAGPDGIFIRMPRQGWFGWFRVIEYRLAWSQIRRLEHVIRRSHGLAVASELQIEPWSGDAILVPRYYFSDSVSVLRERLLTIQAAVGR